MTRVRLRSTRLPHEEVELYGRTYPDGYRHDRWPDHVERVAASVEMIYRYRSRFSTAADLSCGDAAILRGLAAVPRVRLSGVFLKDLNRVRGEAAEPDTWRRHQRACGVSVLPAGPLPDTLEYLEPVVRDGPLGLFVLSETLEHLPDPDDVLRRLTCVSRYLFLSTPLDEPEGSGNTEHYWGWGQDDIHRMLIDSGWSPMEFRKLVPVSTRDYPDAYTYQMWMAVAR